MRKVHKLGFCLLSLIAQPAEARDFIRDVGKSINNSMQDVGKSIDKSARDAGKIFDKELGHANDTLRIEVEQSPSDPCRSNPNLPQCQFTRGLSK